MRKLRGSGYEFSPPWDFCSADECSLVGPSDPITALALLTESHSDEQLLDSGIAIANPDGRLSLHSLLTTPNVLLVTLFDTNRGELLNLMTEVGCVLGDNIPMFEVVHDNRTRDAFDLEQSIFVTESIADTMLLRSFGVAAAPISGFDRFNQRGIELLYEHYGLAQYPSEREKEEELESQMQQREQENTAAAAAKAAGDMPGPQLRKQNGVPANGTRLSDYVRIGARHSEPEKSDTFKLTFVR